MKKAVIRSIIDQDFTPKDRTERWRVCFGPNTSSGYDFSLVIENPETRISYEIEVGILEDGRLSGQITPDQKGIGGDALVVFDTTPDVARISGNWGGPKFIIRANGEKPAITDDTEESTSKGFY
jgi:hypothetical protein